MKAANRKRSAGLLMYRRRAGIVEVFLAHPGGPFWAKKDAWTIPKGEYDDSEGPLDAARREFQEETGFTARGPFLPLGEIRQASGKLVIAWAFEGDCDPDCIQSNTYQMEWPPKSGKFVPCPEVDRAEFFRMAEARKKINPAQVALLEELERKWRSAISSDTQ